MLTVNIITNLPRHHCYVRNMLNAGVLSCCKIRLSLYPKMLACKTAAAQDYSI
jgi:hypothetical protein